MKSTPKLLSNGSELMGYLKLPYVREFFFVFYDSTRLCCRASHASAFWLFCREAVPPRFLAFFCREAHAAPCTPAPAPAGLSLLAGLRYFGLLGGNVSQFCALFRLFWRKRDWNCATLPHPGDVTPPETPSLLSKAVVAGVFGNMMRFCSSVVVDYVFDQALSHA